MKIQPFKIFRKKEIKEETNIPSDELSSLLNEMHRLDNIIEELNHECHIKIERMYPHVGLELPIRGLSSNERELFIAYIRHYYKEKRQGVLNKCVKLCKEHEDTTA